MVLLSIVTINLNNAAGLHKTLQSVQQQQADWVEHIIVDGASTDESLAVINEHAGRLSCWLSEKDEGVYDAMNKGIRLAKGEYVFFLNSGDTFYDNNTLAAVAKYLNNSTDLVYGNVRVIEKDKTYFTGYPQTLSFSFLFKYVICQQAIFYRRSVFDNCGLFPKQYRICADWAHFTKAVALHNATYTHMPVVIATYYFDGISSLPENYPKIQSERSAFLSSSFPLFYKDYEDYTELLLLKRYSLLRSLDANPLLRRTATGLLLMLNKIAGTGHHR